MRPENLWPRLTAQQQQALLQILSELIQRQLLGPQGQEVTDEPR
jgi:hypothetical protein